jgi:hypothetical protein
VPVRALAPQRVAAVGVVSNEDLGRFKEYFAKVRPAPLGRERRVKDSLRNLSGLRFGFVSQNTR